MNRVTLTSMDMGSRGPSVKPLPEGEMVLYRREQGRNFEISMKIVSQDGNAAYDIMNDIGNIFSSMYSNNATAQDVDRALYKLAEWRAYFTTWRYTNKLVPQEQYDALKEQLDATTKEIV